MEKDMISQEVSSLPTMENKMIDLLDRQDFVKQMLYVAETLSNGNKNASYAINGSWGVGKSFVLDMFEQQASLYGKEGEVLSRYSVFRYNCWEYDYYDEPLIALVASILDQIDKKENLIPKDFKEKFVETIKVVGKGLIKRGIQIVDGKLGGILEPSIEAIKEGCESANARQKETNAFDEYFAFKRTLEDLRDGIEELAKYQTVIFIVDELDRCLPEYSIKVLERLHHIFDNISNVQLIIALDKRQFGRVINRIFGEHTDVDKYLAKFIDFEMNLTEGNFNREFDKKFEYYVKNFEYLSESTGMQDIAHFKENIFSGMDIRTRIKIIEKCNLLHEILEKEDEKKDYSFMCVEIAFVVMKHWGVDLFASQPSFYISNIFNIDGKMNNSGLYFLNKKLEKRSNGDIYYKNANDEFGRSSDYVRRDDIWGVVLSCYRYVVGYTKDKLHNDGYSNFGLREYSRDFRNLLYTIS